MYLVGTVKSAILTSVRFKLSVQFAIEVGNAGVFGIPRALILINTVDPSPITIPPITP